MVTVPIYVSSPTAFLEIEDLDMAPCDCTVFSDIVSVSLFEVLAFFPSLHNANVAQAELFF